MSGIPPSIDAGQLEGRSSLVLDAHGAAGLMSYRQDIDGLRGIAVLSVVLYHAFPSLLPGGFIGVDIFFVISGFLITSILIEAREAGAHSLIHFYMRRVRRLFPALILVLLTVLALGWHLLFADEYRQLGLHTVGASAFVSNLLLWRESGYFDTVAVSKPLLHLWSLGIEEQFYLFWPLLLWLARKGPRWRLWLIGSILGASFAWNILSYQRDPVGDFYAPMTRFWELAAGSLLAVLPIARQASQRHRDLAAWSGALLITTGLIWAEAAAGFPGYQALLPVMGGGLLVFSGMSARLNRTLLAAPPLVWLGLISYPLYLWHWPLLSLLRIVHGEATSPGLRLGVLVSSIGLAVATYCLLERPFRRGRRGGLKAAVLVFVMTLVATLGILVQIQGGFAKRPIAVLGQDIDYATGTAQFHFPPCPASLRDIQPPLSYCSQSRDGLPDIAIIGDSFSNDKYYGIASLDSQRIWVLAGKGGCPPAYGVVAGDGCREVTEKVVDWAAGPESPQRIVLALLGRILTPIRLGDEQHAAPPAADAMSQMEILRSGLEETIRRITSAGKQLVVLMPQPELSFAPKDCVRRPLDSCVMPRAESEAYQAEIRQFLMSMAERYPIRIYDPYTLLCDSRFCHYQREGRVDYYDKFHLSIHGSFRYARALLAWLDAGEQ